MVARLKPYQADRLREQELTYPEVGATAGSLPDGYHHLTHENVIGQGRDLFEAAARDLMRWKLQERAGLRVAASWATVEVGGVAVVRLGPGPLALRAPVRVVQVIEEDRRRGFVYGTLPGHPECGEESFVVSIEQDQSVVVRIVAFSRPASLLARLGGPVSKAVQRAVTRRYGRALVPGRRG